jgi:MerR-like DNA binding protein
MHTFKDVANDRTRRPRRDRAVPSPRDPMGHVTVAGLPVQFVARLTGIPARSINFWTGPARVLKPDYAYHGRGSAKRFSLRNLVQLRVIALLAERGVALASIRALIAQAEHHRGFGEDWFAWPPTGEAHPARGPREFLTCAQPGGWVHWYFPPAGAGAPDSGPGSARGVAATVNGFAAGSAAAGRQAAAPASGLLTRAARRRGCRPRELGPDQGRLGDPTRREAVKVLASGKS